MMAVEKTRLDRLIAVYALIEAYIYSVREGLIQPTAHAIGNKPQAYRSH
jgi:hypothetical protein